MKLYEIMSYKTFYYFVKDPSALLLPGYKVEQDDEDFKSMNQQDFYDMFEDCRRGDIEGYTEIRTNYGSVVYHSFPDVDEIKEFLVRNSMRKPCAVFGSHRTVDVYLFGFADKSKVNRLFFQEEVDPILEGERTEYEDRIGLDLDSVPEDDLFVAMDEEKVFQLANQFVGFDIENDDVEILGVYYYTKLTEEDYIAKKEDKTTLVDNVLPRVINNLTKYGLEAVTLSIMKEAKSDRLYLLSFTNKDDDSDKFGVQYANITDITDEEDFKNCIKKCINGWAEANLKFDYDKPLFKRCATIMSRGNKTNSITMMISRKRPNMLTLTKTMSKGKLMSRFAVSLATKIIPALTDGYIGEIYSFCKKKLK